MRALQGLAFGFSRPFELPKDARPEQQKLQHGLAQNKESEVFTGGRAARIDDEGEVECFIWMLPRRCNPRRPLFRQVCLGV
jgi:hypothetical protein